MNENARRRNNYGRPRTCEERCATNNHPSMGVSDWDRKSLIEVAMRSNAQRFFGRGHDKVDPPCTWPCGVWLARARAFEDCRFFGRLSILTITMYTPVGLDTPAGIFQFLRPLAANRSPWTGEYGAQRGAQAVRRWTPLPVVSTRRRILQELRTSARTVGELVDALAVTQPTMSKQRPLALLRAGWLPPAGFAAQHRIYRLEAGLFVGLDEWLAPLPRVVGRYPPRRSSERHSDRSAGPTGGSAPRTETTSTPSPLCRCSRRRPDGER